MGCNVYIKHILKLSKEEGFPLELRVEDHQANPDASRQFLGRSFEFEREGQGVHYYHAPQSVFLVEDVKGKWLYWGRAEITRQVTDSDTVTPRGKISGKYVIVKIYDPESQKVITREESDYEQNYFKEFPRSANLDISRNGD